MAEQLPDDDKFLINVERAVHYTQDGTITESGVFTNMEQEEAREHVAEIYDIPSESVFFGDEAGASRGARLSVGFRKWRSGWDPHAEIDPNLN